MLQIETRHLEIINSILSKYPYNFYAYGSRVKGTSRKYSDLDLCYREEIRRAHPGQVFEDSEELLRHAREERTKELEQR